MAYCKLYIASVYDCKSMAPMHYNEEELEHEMWKDTSFIALISNKLFEIYYRI